MTAPLDPRTTPARAGIAAKHLQGKVEARRFVEGEIREVVEAQAPLRLEPSPEAPLATEVLMGERVAVYDTDGEGWSWGQIASDGYVGWLPANALAPPRAAATHRVAALRTFVFPGPSIKLPPLVMPPFGAHLAIARIEGSFAVGAKGGFVPLQHLAPIDSREGDWVGVAERFLGTPYLWGGKTNLGIDCSGLVQVAVAACGISCPRDSDLQEQSVGSAVALEPELGNLRRGDLIFWKGHVAIVRDEASIIHANAFHMAVAVEPLREALQRIGPTGLKVTGIRRPAAVQ